MSRIGNKPIVIPEGIEVKIQDSEIIVKGQKGELLTKIVDDRIKFEINEGTLIFSRDSELLNLSFNFDWFEIFFNSA